MGWIIYGKHGWLIWLMLGTLALGWPWAALGFGTVWLLITMLRCAMSGDDLDICYAVTGLRLASVPRGLIKALIPLCGLQIALAGARVLGWTAQGWWWIMTPTMGYLALGFVLLAIQWITHRRLV